MKRCSARPYEGSDKYIFISYCHRDKAQVFPIIEQLAKDGHRVWYDEGIDPGSEWPEIIAKHLNGSSICLAFITPNALNSHNCRREINFALLKKKHFISVILEPTEMSLGMEMQLSSSQSIFKYTLSGENEFFDKLYEAKELENCKGAPDNSIVVSSPNDYLDEPNNSDKVRDPFSDRWFVEGDGETTVLTPPDGDEEERKEEEERRKAEAEEAARIAAEEEKRKAEEAARIAAEEEEKRKAEEAARVAAEEEEKRKAEEAARIAAEEEEKRKAEEAARIAAEEEERRKELARRLDVNILLSDYNEGDVVYCCIMHHPLRSARVTPFSYPVDEVHFVYNGLMDNSCLSEKTRLSIDINNRYATESGHCKNINALWNQKVEHYLDICDAMESWDFIFSKSPIDPTLYLTEYVRQSDGVYARKSDLLEVEKRRKEEEARRKAAEEERRKIEEEERRKAEEEKRRKKNTSWMAWLYLVFSIPTVGIGNIILLFSHRKQYKLKWLHLGLLLFCIVLASVLKLQTVYEIFALLLLGNAIYAVANRKKVFSLTEEQLAKENVKVKGSWIAWLYLPFALLTFGIGNIVLLFCLCHRKKDKTNWIHLGAWIFGFILVCVFEGAGPAVLVYYLAILVNAIYAIANRNKLFIKGSPSQFKK